MQPWHIPNDKQPEELLQASHGKHQHKILWVEDEELGAEQESPRLPSWPP